MSAFKQFQQDLERQLESLAAYPEISRTNISLLLDKLRQNRFNLVMLGAFKRGKSTLINALLGEPLLPTAVIPLTSVVTIIGYGEEVRIEVLFHNGQRQQIPSSELAAYITERGNPQNIKGVQEVDIAYPSEYLKDGVRIIDTPGVGSIYSHNTEVAYNYLPQVDAAIFVITVDPPLSAAEEEFLKDIREYVHKLFFVLNKIDYVEEAERQEALDFTRQVLQANLVTDKLPIFPLTAKLALEGKQQNQPDVLAASLLPQFEEHLRTFLYQEKGRVLLVSCINGALKTITDSTLALKVERHASAMSRKDLEEKIGRFNFELQGLEKEREMSLLLLDGRMKGIFEDINADLEAFKKETLSRLHQEVQDAFQQKVRGSGDLRQEMEVFLFGALRNVFTLWRRDEIDRIAQRLGDIHQEFADRINEILARLTQLTARIFDFSLRGFSAETALTEKSQFWFKFKEDPVGLEIIQMTVTSLLPRALTRGLLLKKLLENVDELVDKHCGRLRYDFQTRLNDLGRDFRQTWLAKIDDTTASIRQALDRALAQKQVSDQNATARLGELDQRLAEILQAEGALLSLKEKIQFTLH
ncbi:MAG: hypothetical protein FJ135_08435 [Deltaproteobacteria bacterium]|nr:hypothetical protein [Deltaproteobacteria bacterium]